MWKGAGGGDSGGGEPAEMGMAGGLGPYQRWRAIRGRGVLGEDPVGWWWRRDVARRCILQSCALGITKRLNLGAVQHFDLLVPLAIAACTVGDSSSVLNSKAVTGQ